MDTLGFAQAIEPPVITVPLSLRIGEARIQLGAMFDAGELAPLEPSVRATLRGLEGFLLDASLEVLHLESDAAIAKFARRRRVPRWLRFGGGRI